MKHAITDALLPGDLIFDIGANVGDKATWYAEKGLNVVCIEPQPEPARILKSRFSSNENVVVRQVGVGARKEYLEMHISSTNSHLSTFAPHWKKGRFSEQEWDHIELVEIITLDDLIAEFGVPRFTKIDVEGHEREVIKGLSKKIGIISYEFTNEFMDHSLEVLYKLIQLGYTKFNLSLAENPSFYFPTWAPYFELASILNSNRATSDLWGDIYAN